MSAHGDRKVIAERGKQEKSRKNEQNQEHNGREVEWKAHWGQTARGILNCAQPRTVPARPYQYTVRWRDVVVTDVASRGSGPVTTPMRVLLRRGDTLGQKHYQGVQLKTANSGNVIQRAFNMASYRSAEWALSMYFSGLGAFLFQLTESDRRRFTLERSSCRVCLFGLIHFATCASVCQLAASSEIVCWSARWELTDGSTAPNTTKHQAAKTTRFQCLVELAPVDGFDVW